MTPLLTALVVVALLLSACLIYVLCLTARLLRRRLSPDWAKCLFCGRYRKNAETFPCDCYPAKFNVCKLPESV